MKSKLSTVPTNVRVSPIQLSSGSSDTSETRGRRRSLLVLLGLLIAPWAYGCGQPNVYQEPPPPVVDVVHPLQRAVTSYVEQTGNAHATKRVELRARVAGFLYERNFEDGEVVREGQLLFVIDEEPFKVKLQHAEAKEREAIANLKKAEQSKSREVAGAQLTLREAEYRLAQAQHARNSQLLSTKSISRQDYDETESALRTTEAQLLATRSEQEQANVDYDNNILVAQAALELARAEANTAKIDLSYCRIYAPIDGQIDRRVVDVGNYISPDQSTVLATIVQLNPIYAYAAISEGDLATVRREYGNSIQADKPIPIFMGIGDERSFLHEGNIDYISPTVQAGTGTVQVRGIFANNGEILPGMFVRIRIPSHVNPTAILLPERAIGYDQAGTYVYTLNSENEIQRKTVKVKDAVDGLRVIEGELTTEDRVIADGLQKVRPELKVEIAPAATDTPSPVASVAQ